MTDTFNIHNYFKRGKTVVLTLRHGEEETRQWADKDVADLLSLMKSFHPQFKNPRKRKKEVWDEVASELLRKGYSWSSEDCRKKWSNMIRTFKSLEEQCEQGDPTYSSKKLKWPVYDRLHELLTMDYADAFPEAHNCIQLLKKNSQTRAARKSKNRHSPKASSSTSSSASTTSQQLPPQHQQQNQQFTVHHHHQVQTVENDDNINLVSDSDIIDIGLSLSAHHDSLTSQVHAPAVNVLEPSIVFTQPTIYKDIIVPSTSSLTSAAPAPAAVTSTPLSGPGIQSITKTSLAVRAKKIAKRKYGGKDKKAEDSIDSMLAKFVETTNKQNEQMLTKMTTFHESALNLMRERNQMLREICDGLHTGVRNAEESLMETSQNAGGEENNTLTFQVGPAYSIGTSNVGTANQHLNPTLIISNAGDKTGSVLGTFQLDNATVLSSLGGKQDNGVLNHLGFAQSILPEQLSLIHPSLVSVVSDNGHGSSEMALALQKAAAALTKRDPNIN